MPWVKLVISYDGTRYVSWQLQANGPSIQAEVERALATLHKGPVRVTGAGRTDAGVHALGQVAGVRVATRLAPAELLRALNALLPQDVAVRAGGVLPSL